MRGLTGLKFCTMVSTRPSFIMRGGRKTCKIWPDFRRLRSSPANIRNGWRYSKSDFYSVYCDSSCVRRIKSGEVRSSDLGDLDVKSYPPKAHFSEEHISAPRGCCAPKFLRALESDQVLLAHLPPGTAAPPYNFFQRGVKNWLKLQ